MSHAERCPVCGGTGEWMSPWDSCGVTKQTCHGCNGCGWVAVPDIAPVEWRKADGELPDPLKAIAEFQAEEFQKYLEQKNDQSK